MLGSILWSPPQKGGCSFHLGWFNPVESCEKHVKSIRSFPRFFSGLFPNIQDAPEKNSMRFFSPRNSKSASLMRCGEWASRAMGVEEIGWFGWEMMRIFRFFSKKRDPFDTSNSWTVLKSRYLSHFLPWWDLREMLVYEPTMSRLRSSGPVGARDQLARLHYLTIKFSISVINGWFL